MSMGRRIRTLRKNNGLTQQGLSEVVGVSRIYIQALESNRRMPSMKLLHRLAESLNASVTDIVEDIPNKVGRMQLEELLISGEFDVWYRAKKLSRKDLKRIDRIIAALLEDWGDDDAAQ
ncbi:MAG: helix-turn-helix domain-containing protein [Synergistaceae bacterium]|jgi:transcriptional regulator with XRE-family HTH domain|nr:helix-turn-helix domain-containing protein [Synergistaceae bacterium]